MNRREWVVFHQFQPGGFKVAFLSVSKPRLNILSGWTRCITGRQPIQIKRRAASLRAGSFGVLMEVRWKRSITGVKLGHGVSEVKPLEFRDRGSHKPKEKEPR
jgi:hypothetical protein